MSTLTLSEQLEVLLKPAIHALGYEFVGIELIGSIRHRVLRVYIDAAAGISVEDCSIASRQISAILDVEDPIHNPYTLEVSSPGVNRVLFKLADYRRHLGCQISIRLKHLVAGRRRLTGEIAQVSEKNQQIKLITPVNTYHIDWGNIDKANLVANV